MFRRMSAAAAVIAAAGSALLGCGGSAAPSAEEAVEVAELSAERAGMAAGPAAPAPAHGLDESRSVERDREIFETTIERALSEGIDSLPIGRRITAIGRWFIGADYVPGTLEVVPERLVVNLEQFDCVTYVESVLAIARVLDGSAPTFDAFLEELRTIRYRGGVLAGYPSRLHYFSDWIRDNERLGIVRDITQELGGTLLEEPIDFMSANRGQYPALQSPEQLEQIRSIEQALSESRLYFIPKERIGAVASQIRDGDIIAATSAIRGLDVAHTGFAVWVDGELHFMNAPLVGSSVEISQLPLAERIRRIDGQDGIMVARPVD